MPRLFGLPSFSDGPGYRGTTQQAHADEGYGFGSRPKASMERGTSRLLAGYRGKAQARAQSPVMRWGCSSPPRFQPGGLWAGETYPDFRAMALERQQRNTDAFFGLHGHGSWLSGR